MKMSRGVGTNRITLRMPDYLRNVLKKESDEKVLPLNAVINRILTKHIVFDMRMDALPSVTISQMLLSKVISELDSDQKTNASQQGPLTVKKLFTKLNLKYNIQNVVDEYFSMLGKYCGWFTFHFEINKNHYRLVFESDLGQDWMTFLTSYVREILKSLKVHIELEQTDDSVLVFEFVKV